MECGKTIEELVPLIAAVKLMSNKEMIIKYSEIMWDMVTAYTDIKEHGGFKWEHD